MQGMHKPKPTKQTQPYSPNRPIRLALALAAVLLLCACASGCGSSGSTKTDSKHHARSGTVAARAAHKPTIVADYSGGYLKSDDDADEDDKGKHIPPAKSDDTL